MRRTTSFSTYERGKFHLKNLPKGYFLFREFMLIIFYKAIIRLRNTLCYACVNYVSHYDDSFISSILKIQFEFKALFKNPINLRKIFFPQKRAFACFH